MGSASKRRAENTFPYNLWVLEHVHMLKQSINSRSMTPQHTVQDKLICIAVIMQSRPKLQLVNHGGMTVSGQVSNFSI